MEIFELLLPLALIIAVAKVLGLAMRRIGLPEVVGMLIAGILLGLIQLIPGQEIFVEGGTLQGISFIAEIGVILIMFTAGLETDIKMFKKVGFPSVVITLLGVMFPLGLGFVVACAFNPEGGFSELWDSDVLLSNLFYGCILCATSVSLTVATLKEMGRLQSKVGATVLAAAILDDIIAIVIISIVTSIKQTGAASAVDIVITIAKIIGFFVAALVIGVLALRFFMILTQRRPRAHRLPIFAIALCFFYSYAAQKWFGVADITGAYVAGLVLSMAAARNYIDRRIEISTYLFFEPVFFANIGILMIGKLSGAGSSFDPIWIGFGAIYIVIALISKIIGCGAGALMFKYNFKDSLRTGIGMMARAEVALVCANMGIELGLISVNIMPFIIILIIVSSMLVPALLKLAYRHEAPIINAFDSTPDDFSTGLNNSDLFIKKIDY